MSGLDTRSDRLYPGLSASERVLLAIQAAYEDRPIDWQIYSTMPNDQVAEFNRSIGLRGAAARVLLPCIAALEQELQALDLRLTLLSVLVLWKADRDELTPQREPRTKIRKRAEGGARPTHGLLAAIAPAEESLPVGAPLSEPERLFLAVGEQVRSDVVSLSTRYVALDSVLAELQQQTGGDDMLQPQLRAHLERTRASLTKACEDAVAFVGELDLPVDDAATRELMLACVQEAAG